MKKNSFLSALSVLLFAVNSAHAVLITGFGTGDFSITYVDFATTNQTTNYLDISGVDSGNQLNGNFSSVSVSANMTQGLLTGTNLGGAPASLFAIFLFDSANNYLRYNAYWNSFPLNVPTTITMTQAEAQPGWNGTAVKLQISTGGLGDSINMRLDEFSVIPEPSAVWVLGVGIVFLALGHRRFKHKN